MANRNLPQQAPQQMQPQEKKISFSQFVQSKSGQQLIANAIPNPQKREKFATAVIAAVSVNPQLMACTPATVLSAAIQGAALGLAPSPQLGQFYMVPFKNKAKYDKDGNLTKPETMDAVFVPGYKGYIQLALRTGQYLDLDARPVVDGEYKGLDRITGRPTFEWIEDDTLREQMAVIGYMAYFELTNGARKVLYWSKEKMIAHADRYSPAFSKEATPNDRYPKVSYEDYLAGNYPQKDEWKYSSFWYKDFDTMACKTMLRQLITKWGPVSIEMQTAIEKDNQGEEIGADYGVEFTAAAVPNVPDYIDAEAEDIPDEPETEEAAPDPAPAEEQKAVDLDDI